MSGPFTLGCERSFLEVQLREEKLSLMGHGTSELLRLLNPLAMIVNTSRLEYHQDHSLRLSAFSVIMKRFPNESLGFMVLGRENGSFGIGLVEEVTIDMIHSLASDMVSISVPESLRFADSRNRAKVTLKDKDEQLPLDSGTPIGFVRGGFEVTQRYTRNVGVIYPWVAKFDSCLVHQTIDNFNGVTWMSQEQLEEFHKDTANIFDPWSNELIKNLDKFVILVNRTA